MTKFSFFLGFTALVIFISFNDASSQEYFVASIEDQPALKISNNTLEDHLEAYNQEANIQEMLLQKVGKNYYLIASEAEGKFIYAFYLKNNNGKLFLDQRQYIHACESRELSINIFRISDKKILGCYQFNHKLMAIE